MVGVVHDAKKVRICSKTLRNDFSLLWSLLSFSLFLLLLCSLLTLLVGSGAHNDQCNDNDSNGENKSISDNDDYNNNYN